MTKDLANLGSAELPSSGEVLQPRLKLSRSRLGYYSMFAAIPALVVSHIPKALSDCSKKTETTVPERGAIPKKLNVGGSTPALLKRQSAYRLPHQKGSLSILAALSGNDDCPGRLIPEGNYTAAAPFIDSGDTTGANNTVNSLYSFYYDHYDATGPDLIYTFTLTSLGSNPEIQVSATSSTYKPLIYILDGRCPVGTGNDRVRWDGAYSNSNGVATIDSHLMQFIPLNVPLFLVVDGEDNDALGSGPYTLRMQDVNIAPESACATPNPIDCPDFMVRQHYEDFLNREPDTAGFNFWTNEITSCGQDAQCTEIKRINVSAAFFLSIEFQETGYLIYKTYATAFGATRIGSTVPLTRSEFLPDVQHVGTGVIVGAANWRAQLEANQTAYFNEFVQRSTFAATYPATMANSQFVDALNTNAGNVLSVSERDQLVLDLTSGAKTRAQVLRAIVENADLTRALFNRAFVLMQYFGYLRRNPNDPPDNNFNGYNFWVTKLDQFNGNFVEAEMVKAFITSTEYRHRFGP